MTDPTFRAGRQYADMSDLELVGCKADIIVQLAARKVAMDEIRAATNWVPEEEWRAYTSWNAKARAARARIEQEQAVRRAKIRDYSVGALHAAAEAAREVLRPATPEAADPVHVSNALALLDKALGFTRPTTTRSST